MNIDESFYLEGSNEIGVLLGHGLGGTPSQMIELGTLLNQEGYTVSCPKYRGHGDTIDTLVLTNVYEWYQDYIAALEALMKNVKHVVVMGLSMGGAFSVKAAQNYDVKGLFTFNAPIVGFPLEENIAMMKKERTDEDFLNLYANYRKKFFQFVTEVGQLSNISKITAPIRIFQGAKDADCYKISSALMMYHTNSSSIERYDYKQSGHMMLREEEKLDVFKQVILSLNKLKQTLK